MESIREVNPPPSQGKWTKKTHFGTDFIQNTFSKVCPNDKRKSDVQTGNIVPACLEIFEHNNKGEGLVNMNPSLQYLPQRKHLQNEPICYKSLRGELVWSILDQTFFRERWISFRYNLTTNLTDFEVISHQNFTSSVKPLSFF